MSRNWMGTLIGLALVLGVIACGGSGGGGGGGGGGGPSTPTPGPYLYVPGQDSNVVGVYSLATNGALTSVGTFTPPASASVTSMVADNSGSFAYFLDASAGNVYGYSMAGSTGMTAIAGSPWATTVVSPDSLGVAGNTGWLDVSNTSSDNSQRFSIDPSSGALTAASSSTSPEVNWPCTSRHSTSNVYCASGTAIVILSIAPTTGQVSVTNSYPSGAYTGIYVSSDGTKGVAFNFTTPTGVGTCATNGSVTILPFTININDTLTLATSPTTVSGIYTDTTGDTGWTFGPDIGSTLWLFGGSGTSPTITPNSINYTSGAFTPSAALTDGTAAACVSFMDVAPNLQSAALWPSTGSIQPAAMNPTTGVLTLGPPPISTPAQVSHVESAYTTDSSLYVVVVSEGTGVAGEIFSYSVNQSTGALTQVSSLTTVNNPQGGNGILMSALASAQ